jgi:hypothetical protein
MSVDASIRISLVGSKTKSIPALDIIDVLEHAGWSLAHDGYTSYLPLGDIDDFDWQSEQNMDQQKFRNIISSKELANELIAVILTWQTSDIGFVFLYHQNKSISISITIERQKITLNDNYAITDFQWYLEKILPPLNDAFGVEYFSCEHHI